MIIDEQNDRTWNLKRTWMIERLRMWDVRIYAVYRCQNPENVKFREVEMQRQSLINRQ